MAIAESKAPKTRRDWWPYAALGFLMVQIALAVVPRARPGKAGMVCWYLGGDRLLWWGLALLLLLIAVIRSVWRRPFWNRRRAAGFAMIALLLDFAADVSRLSVLPRRGAERGPVPGPARWAGDSWVGRRHARRELPRRLAGPAMGL